MNKRTVTLMVVAGILALGFLGFKWQRRQGPLEVRTSQIGGGPLVFSFNDDCVFEEVLVIEPPSEAEKAEGWADEDGRVLWQLVPHEPREGQEPPEVQPLRALRYGQGVRGMQRGTRMTERNPAPLVAGVRYLFIARTAGEEVRMDFTPTHGG